MLTTRTNLATARNFVRRDEDKVISDHLVMNGRLSAGATGSTTFTCRDACFAFPTKRLAHFCGQHDDLRGITRLLRRRQ